MIEVLIEGMTNNKGGKETYIINMYRALDKNVYSLTFVAYDDEIAYEDYLKIEGATIVHLPPRHLGFIRHRNAIDKLFKSRKFDVVWAHKTTLSACEILSIAKKNAVPIRIVHSHCSSNMGGKFTFLMHCINKRLIFRMANEYLACSDIAAKWFFGNHPAKIMVNGIDLKKFKYNPEIREKIRKQLDLKDHLVIGHVGRFGIEKNHKKLIRVFYACRQRNEKVKLLLCGDGEERGNIEKQIDELGIHSHVILLGAIDNVNEMLQAMDIIVMPSLFEGLPFALLEAQTAGLKCIVSDTVSQESDIVGWNQFLPLSLSNDLWAEAILTTDMVYNRLVGYEIMKQKGFDITDNVAMVEKIINPIGTHPKSRQAKNR